MAVLIFNQKLLGAIWDLLRRSVKESHLQCFQVLPEILPLLDLHAQHQRLASNKMFWLVQVVTSPWANKLKS